MIAVVGAVAAAQVMSVGLEIIIAGTKLMAEIKKLQDDRYASGRDITTEDVQKIIADCDTEGAIARAWINS